jgi:AraC-like DNA-binding protein
LLHEGLPLKQVAERIGFADTHAFGRAFRRWTGVPPTEMRARALQAGRTATGTLPPD